MAAKNRPSSIDRLPDALRELIKELRSKGRTIDEILAKLHELAGPGDEAVSRSALGRHIKSIEAAGERLRKAAAISEALYSHARSQGEDRLNEINAQLLNASMQTFLLAVDQIDPESGEMVKLAPIDAARLAKAMTDIQRARQIDAQRAKEIQEEQRKKSAEAVDSAGKAMGLSADTVDFIRRAVLGDGE